MEEETEPEPQREPPPEDPPTADGTVPEPRPRRRRRGRTTALICTAAVLGLIAGTCAGYLVQAGREPTKLPSLAGPLASPGKGEVPERLPVAQDRRVGTDGDLRKLLLEKPRGAQDLEWPEGDDGWMGLVPYAETFELPSEQFDALLDDEFRRAAVGGWYVEGSYTVNIRLIQFRQEDVLVAGESVAAAKYWAAGEDTDSWSVPGTGDGRAYVHRLPTSEPGEPPVYTAEAHARRGDVVMEIWVNGDRRISKKTILDLAERQMERL
ncbi:hypothetical protein [Streptomyces sp. NPDC059402]|uniref:hypothetical protein n=1 Tax=Streptomyces sp. NPDC059402 TaxID=3346822 RepID=UPI0036D0EE71